MSSVRYKGRLVSGGLTVGVKRGWGGSTPPKTDNPTATSAVQWLVRCTLVRNVWLFTSLSFFVAESHRFCPCYNRWTLDPGWVIVVLERSWLRGIRICIKCEPAEKHSPSICTGGIQYKSGNITKIYIVWPFYWFLAIHNCCFVIRPASCPTLKGRSFWSSLYYLFYIFRHNLIPASQQSCFLHFSPQYLASFFVQERKET